MDFLSHLTLPLIVAYAVHQEFFATPAYFVLAGFGLLSDMDKFLGVPGLLHSLVTLGPLCLALLAVERVVRGHVRLSPVIVAFIGSHLVLDVVDGGPVPLLFPLIETGIGLQYPVQTVFGSGPFGLEFQGPFVALRLTTPRPGHNTYGFIQGAGVASLLAFVSIVVGDRVSGGWT